MLQELFDLSGNSALITGSSQGIGFTIARGLGLAGGPVQVEGHQRIRLASARRPCGPPLERKGMDR